MLAGSSSVQRTLEQLAHIIEHVEPAASLPQQRAGVGERIATPGSRSSDSASARNSRGSGAAGADLRRQPLQVAHVLQLGPHGAAGRGSSSRFATASAAPGSVRHHVSGRSTQRRSSRAPMGVCVSSITSISVVAPDHGRASDRNGSTSSRLRRVISSSTIASPAALDARRPQRLERDRLHLGQVADQRAQHRPTSGVARLEAEAVQRRDR
jgi:hypothetical protein